MGLGVARSHFLLEPIRPYPRTFIPATASANESPEDAGDHARMNASKKPTNNHFGFMTTLVSVNPLRTLAH